MSTFNVNNAGAAGAGTLGQAFIDAFNDANADADTLNITTGLAIANLGGATLRSDVTLNSSGGVSIAADIAGSGDLTKSGAGALTLSGDNSAQTGAFHIVQGLVIAASDTALGSDATTATIGNAASLRLAADVTLTKNIAIQSGGALDLRSSANAEVSGDVTAAHTAGVAVEIGSYLTLSGELTLAAGDTLNKTGNGHLILGGDNDDLAGTISVNAGVLVAESDQALGTASIYLAHNGSMMLRAGDYANTIVTAGAGYSEIYLYADATLSGDISGGVSLYKTGSGALTLSGDNVGYTGQLVLWDGLTIAASDTALGGGSTVVTVDNVGSLRLAAGAELSKDLLIESRSTLSGVGATSGEVTVNGILASGVNGAGVLHTGDLVLSNSASFDVELGGTGLGASDQVAVTGSVTLAGALNLSLIAGFSSGASAVFRILDNDGSDALAGTFNGFAEGATVTVGSRDFKISYVGGTGNDVTLSYTASAPPEPQPDPNLPTTGADDILLVSSGGEVSAGDGDDQVTGGPGRDWVHGNVGNDRLFGGGGADTIHGGQGQDYLQGNTGDDLLFGDLGDDSIMGGQGQDTLEGGDGGDILLGDLGDDRLLGGAGQDVAQGGDGADYLHGNTGDDVLVGGAGDDTVVGGQGADALSGGDGRDVLSGDLGDDVLTGGAGADVFSFIGGAGRDVITDFSHADGDHIQLSRALAADFAAVLSHTTMVGADAVITLGAETIVLTGVSMNSLTASEFLFA